MFCLLSHKVTVAGVLMFYLLILQELGVIR